MASYVVLVNGLPGAGKSTLAGRLAPALGVPLIGKDAIKESLAAAAPGVPAHAIGTVAALAMWEFAAAVPGGALLESWWFRPRDRGFAEAGLRRCGAARVVEVWCDVPADVALTRVLHRERDPVHDDAHHARLHWPAWTTDAQPLGIGQLIRVSTAHDVDLPTLTSQVDAALRRQAPRPEDTPTEARHSAAAARPPAPLPNSADQAG